MFGIDGPNKNSDSIGQIAGCDDCATNIAIRFHYKSFIASELSRREAEVREEIVKEAQEVIERWYSAEYTIIPANDLAKLKSSINELIKKE